MEAQEAYGVAVNLGSRIVVFELVLDITNASFDVDEALDLLRQYGSAEVVQDFLSTKTYLEAVDVLINRAWS